MALNAALEARKLRQRCVDCHAELTRVYRPKCPRCGGMVEIHYDLARARIGDHGGAAERYFDLLPLEDRSHLLDCGEGETPCVHARALGEQLGLRHLYLKLESANPTRTTKDRMAAVVLSMFLELGVDEFVSSSTGNSSNALAHAIGRHPHFRMHLFLGAEFADRFRYPGRAVREHVLEGQDFTQAFEQARTFARHRALPFEAGFFNPARREGLKLAYLEAVDQVPREIDWYFQAVSSGMGVQGTVKAGCELQALGRIRRPPRLVCVQQSGCAPIVTAFEADSPSMTPEHVVARPSGIAKAILRGDPSGSYPYLYATLKANGGAALAVSAAEILAAQARLQALEGLRCGLCAAATVAALARAVARGLVEPDQCVLLNLTD